MYNVYSEPCPSGKITHPGSAQSKLWTCQEPTSGTGQVSAGQRTWDRVRSTSHLADSRLRQAEHPRLWVQRQEWLDGRELIWL